MTVLVTVKAYPALSKRKGEVVCVAGVRTDTQPFSWIRLYPVAFRDLAFADRFSKYQFISLTASKARSDTRPESWTPDLLSIEPGDCLSTDSRWQRRWDYLQDLAGAFTMCELLEDQTKRRTSLGLIRPKVKDLIIESNAGFSRDQEELANISAQENLLNAAKAPLEPAPYTLHFLYDCETPRCRGHNQTFIDWEAAAAARRWRNEGHADADLPRLLRERFLDKVCGADRDVHFYVGNQHQAPRGFLVLGAYWPPAQPGVQQPLFVP